jgi:hypothetical protein
MNINMTQLAVLYTLLGKEAFRRMVTTPGAVLEKQAKRNRDEPQEMIDKRDAFVDALVDYVEEFANLDQD